MIIIDNAKIYYNKELRNIYNRTNILLKYLSPYLLDLNPIKTLFTILKAWIRRNIDLVEIFIDRGRFSDFLDIIIRA